MTVQLPEWDDPHVQIVYEALCDHSIDDSRPMERHWEGWLAQHIVKRLREAPPHHARPAESPKE